MNRPKSERTAPTRTAVATKAVEATSFATAEATAKSSNRNDTRATHPNAVSKTKKRNDGSLILQLYALPAINSPFAHELIPTGED